MRKSVLILVLLVVLTGGCVSSALQLPDDNNLVAEVDFDDEMETEEDAAEDDATEEDAAEEDAMEAEEDETETEAMSEEALAALYNASVATPPSIGFSPLGRGSVDIQTGRTVFQYEVLYNGVRIQNIFLVIHTDDYGNVIYVDMPDIGNISLDTTPTISQAEAKAIVRPDSGNNSAFRMVELIILPPCSDYNMFRLVWALEDITVGLVGIYVDAHSGEYRVHTAIISGPINDRAIRDNRTIVFCDQY